MKSGTVPELTTQLPIKTMRRRGNRKLKEQYDILRLIFSYDNYMVNTKYNVLTKSPVIATENYLIEHGYNVGDNTVRRILKTYGVKYDKNNNIKYLYLKNI